MVFYVPRICGQYERGLEVSKFFGYWTKKIKEKMAAEYSPHSKDEPKMDD